MKLRKNLKGIKRLVVKVGSNVVSCENGKCDLKRMSSLVDDICKLKDEGIDVLLVSSGAVNIGKSFLKNKKLNSIEAQQAASSIGQPKLIQEYCKLFEANGSVCSQVLLTHDDFKSRQRYLNAKRTIETLFENDVTPILNENDTISFLEITVGDNDQLAAQASVLIDADALLLVTSSDGLYDKDPKADDAKLIKEVIYGQDLGAVDVSTKTSVGRGGMKSKLDAVKKATNFAIQTIISSKDLERIVLDALTKDVGTYFHPREVSSVTKKKLWLASLRSSESFIEVDKGAYDALMGKKSLLPKGIVKVSGEFAQGDCVNLIWDGVIFGRGISFFANNEIELIKGKHSKDIESILGPGRDLEVIHIENLVLEKDYN